MNTNLIKGIAVLVLLIVGWSIETYFLANKAKGIRERHFVIRACIGSLLGIFAFVAIDDLFKGSGAGLGVIWFFAILILRRKQLAIRREETANA
jgi:uncharacterized membrane protein YdjX (TVP38/TMEM64 family)